MAQDSAPTTPTTPADVANAKNRNTSVSAIIDALSTGSSAAVAVLTAIAAAITASIIGGTTGTTANRLLRSKGTGGFALQNTGITCDDSDNLTAVGSVAVVSGGGFKTGTSAGNTALLQAYDVDGAAYTTFGTLTANNTPTFDLAAAVTKGGVGIATLNTNTWLQQQGFARQSLTDASTITWNAQTQQTAYVLLTAGVGATRALGAPSNLVAGFTYTLMVQQSSGGSNALTYNAVYKWPGGVTPTLSTAANAIDILTFITDGTNMYGVIQKAFA